MSSPFNPLHSGGSEPGAAPPAGQGPWAQDNSLITPNREGALAVASPPLPLLVAAGIAAVTGAAIGVMFFSSWLAIVGWVLAGPIAIGLMGAFIRADTDRRAEPVYVRPDWIGFVYAFVVTASVAGIVAGAAGFALWVGRR